MTQLELDFGEEFARPPEQPNEIIEVARHAGFSGSVAKMWIEPFEAFAKLVAAKEREACLQIQEDWQYTYANDLVQKIRARGEA